MNEAVKLWQIPRFGNLELLHARFIKQSFPRHTHERYAIGVIERGALGFYYRGANVVAVQGQVSLCIPGEVHTGRPASAEGWGYRMFYFDTHFLHNLSNEITDKSHGLPFFQSGVIENINLARQIRNLHHSLEQPGDPLQQETALLSTLADLMHHADSPPIARKTAPEPKAVRQVKDYLEAHYFQEVSLGDLCQLTQLSRFYLVRVFAESVGIPPHAYLRQIRIREAKRALALGRPIAEVALESGFSDQSHLNRWFRRLWGITPAQYRNSVQDQLKFLSQAGVYED